jgi:hypothetical protein
MKTPTPHASSERGFIALMSVIIISAILLVLMIGVSTASFWARFDSLGNEERQIARGLAQSCINVALLALATSSDPTHYAPSKQSVIVGVDARGNVLTCTIKDVVHTGQNVTIEAYASSGGSFSTASATATLPPDIKIISWGDH